jgi:hypothetical protein
MYVSQGKYKVIYVIQPCTWHKMWDASLIFNSRTLTLGLGHVGSWVLSPNSLEVNMCNLNVESLEVGLDHFIWDPKSQVWYGCLHDNIFWRGGFGLVVRVGWSIKLNLTLNTIFASFFALNNQDLTLIPNEPCVKWSRFYKWIENVKVGVGLVSHNILYGLDTLVLRLIIFNLNIIWECFDHRD